MKSTTAQRFGALSLWLAISLAPAFALEPAGNVSHLIGVLSAQHLDGSKTLLSLKSAVHGGDQLDTSRDSYARVKFLDESELILKPDSRVKIDQYRYVVNDPAADRSVIELLKGGLRRVSGLIGKRNPPRDTVNTPVAMIGIRGTHYGLLLCQQDCGHIATLSGEPLKDGVHIDVAQGEVALSNSGGALKVTAGQFAYVRDNLTAPVLVPPGLGVQVTAPSSILKNHGRGQTLDITDCDGQCVMQ